MKVPFVGGSYTGRSTNVNAQRCVNLFPVVDAQDGKEYLSLFGTPGLKSFCALESTSYTPIRGTFATTDFLYAVIGSAVYEVDKYGVKTSLGNITTSGGNVSMASNGTQVIVVDGTAHGYLIEDSVMTAISDTDFPAASSVTFQDGYFIVTETDTGKIWISGLYDGDSWDALDYATAEASPDYALRVLSNVHDLWIFGEQTAEVFYNSGDADFPFVRIPGAVLEVGLGAADSAVKIDGFLYWLSEKGQAVKNNGYQYKAISTPHIDYQIASYPVISDAKGYTYTLEGHTFYVLTFPSAGHTWVLDTTTGYWHEWESYRTASPGESPWGRHRANCGVLFGRKNIVGDYENGNLYELDMDTYTDYGQEIRRIRCAQAISKEGRAYVIFHSLEVEFESGVGLSGGVQGEDPQACLDWSDDGGHAWSNEHWVSIGKIGEYKRRAIWRRMGKSRNRILRLTITDPVKVVILGAFAELEGLRA